MTSLLHHRKDSSVDEEGKDSESSVSRGRGILLGMFERVNVRALGLLLTWYGFSALTLFLNKYILNFMNGDGVLLGCFQMLVTTLGGYFQIYFPLGMTEPSLPRNTLSKQAYVKVIIIGSLRFSTVVLGLAALRYVEVSFTETVKSSSPAFTVFISRIVLGEVTGLYVMLSLIPVMAGLALCSLNEISFNVIGFLAALGTNISECLQNVYSKQALCGLHVKLSAAEMQFYTGMASFVALTPLFFYFVDLTSLMNYDMKFWYCCLLNGIFFHFQTITNFALLDHISPVTHSVANSAKRALLIILSVGLFGNQITFLSGIGTCVVFVGVVFYNKALIMDKERKERLRTGVEDY